ncbi:N-acetylmuramoyl-L-alanine amidase [Anaerosalibacter massiliensis]|uniref:N-acetylmuramoyl-L-alanine amidase n=1 Tax=Anaerosalibacter massiliensis TaxID=1347392 RepID=A0A9X2S5F6_9FIRM|nr:N-acetylmuramoyl-L-alanine amidase [Anaerosalibacter massiliensis]MCR2044264.1 N-acetylmuramoyl-L-alanine amidase [Anaerosalibacter massiliensis]
MKIKKRARIYVIKLNKKIISLILIIILAIIIIAFFNGFNSTEIFKHSSGEKIIIDPGHGGIDGGTGDKGGLLEKDVNLDVALYLKEELMKDGFNVIMTREEDESLEDFSSINASRYRRDLNARKSIINKNKPKAFVSIHVNSSKKTTARGVQVYYYPGSNESQELARNICKSIDINVYEKFLKSGELKVKVLPEDYFILRETECTGVLVEIGFITNPEDNALLKNDKYKRKIAYSIKEGVKMWLE